MYVFVLHATTDPAADVHAYYDAGARLNAGIPLYEQPATTTEAAYYRYPPLLAVAFRPLALLPFEVAASLWMVVLIAAVVGSVWLAGVPGPGGHAVKAALEVNQGRHGGRASPARRGASPAP